MLKNFRNNVKKWVLAYFCIIWIFDPLAVFLPFLFIDITKSAHQGVKIGPFFTRNNFYKDIMGWKFIKTCKKLIFWEKRCFLAHFVFRPLQAWLFLKIFAQKDLLLYIFFKNRWLLGGSSIKSWINRPFFKNTCFWYLV